MLVLASARELILLFVAFELMSIPLYFLTGFLKRDEVAPEGALKFFLVGTVSSAVIALRPVVRLRRDRQHGDGRDPAGAARRASAGRCSAWC